MALPPSFSSALARGRALDPRQVRNPRRVRDPRRVRNPQSMTSDTPAEPAAPAGEAPDALAAFRGPFDLENATLEALDVPYKGYGEMRRYVLRHDHYDGGRSDALSRECFVTGNAVFLLPYDPIANTVLLVEQFRVAPFAQGLNPWMFEAIAGRFEPGECEADVALREAQEEAGARVDNLESFGAYFQSPGIFWERITYFVGRFRSQDIAGVHGLEEEGEDIRPVVVPLPLAIEACDEGSLVSAPAALALNWLARHHKRLAAQWRDQPWQT
ncbi:MAG: NUDIX domain-containing protein [Pseudomonadota bacterium]